MDLDVVDPGQQVVVPSRVAATGVGVDPLDASVHGTDDCAGGLGGGRVAERGGGDVLRRAPQSAPRVGAEVAVLVDAGHGPRVQRLGEQGAQAPDDHRGVTVDPPRHAVRSEQARICRHGATVPTARRLPAGGAAHRRRGRAAGPGPRTGPGARDGGRSPGAHRAPADRSVPTDETWGMVRGHRQVLHRQPEAPGASTQDFWTRRPVEHRIDRRRRQGATQVPAPAPSRQAGRRSRPRRPHRAPTPAARWWADRVRRRRGRCRVRCWRRS